MALRVGVRPFRPKRTNNQGQSWAQQSASAGGFVQSQQDNSQSQSNVKTTTGKNLAELGILLNKPASELSPADASLVDFSKIDDANKYRVDFIEELLDVKHGKLEVDGFLESELEIIMDFLCTS